jgi:D-alanyl-D-alanine carboxypeptidase/D-alanyl-D-alanine-endopeptidase (penicillin-binding protein 4)
VVAVASMTALGAGTTLPTRVVQGAGDTVVLVGGGDMMLAAGKGSSTAIVGHAGLADLATQVAKKLRLQGVTSVHLGLDDSLFTGPAVNPGWHPDYLTGGFAAPVTSIAVDIAKTREGEYVPRWSDPSMQAAQTFAKRLGEAGVTVVGSPRRTSADAGATALGEVRSAPLGQVLQYTLETSDNTIAEVLARLVAVHEGLPATFEGGAQADLHVVAGLGVDTTAAHLADASGLADGSVLPPDLLVGLLRLVTDPDHPTLRPIAVGMPIGGLTGTLDDRFTQSPARGLVRAKTGSLTHVTSLAGTVQSADGRQLVFVVMADKTPAGGQDPPRRAIDAFVTALSGCGCR